MSHDTDQDSSQLAAEARDDVEYSESCVICCEDLKVSLLAGSQGAVLMRLPSRQMQRWSAGRNGGRVQPQGHLRQLRPSHADLL